MLPRFPKNPISAMKGKFGRMIPIGEGWSMVFGYSPDTYPEIEKGRALEVFKDKLYVGTRHIEGAQIWRSDDGTDWEQCVGPDAKTPAGFGDKTAQILCLKTCEGELYAGTETGMWVTYDGDVWNQVIGLESQIESITSFGNNLYAAGGKSIWRGKGVLGWVMVVGDQPSAFAASGFGDKDITDITRLEVFGNRLYAGAGMDKIGSSGIAVWSTDDGVNWKLFHKQYGNSMHIYTMTQFDEHLFVGGYHGKKIYRTNGNPGDWVNITDGIDTGYSPDGGGVWSAAICDEKLMLGAIGVFNGKILWSTTDGSSWEAEDTSSIGKTKNVVDAILRFNDYLYLTTRRMYLGPGPHNYDKLEIWRYGQRYLPQYLVIDYIKPFLGVLPTLRIPPPPVIFEKFQAWINKFRG